MANKFKNPAQRKAVMSKFNKGERCFLHEVLTRFEQQGETVGSRLMAKSLKRKVKQL